MTARLLTAAALLLASLPALAAMSVDRAILAFKPGDPNRQDVTVFNPDDEPLYVKVEVLEVINPGTPDEKREPVTDPEKIQLLATPNKLMVEPGGRKVVRLVNLAKSRDTEAVYRVNLTPVAGKVIATGDTSNAVALKILVGYQLLVLVSPDKPQEGLQVVRKGTRATLRNTGNTNILFFGGYQCPDALSAPEQCTPLPDLRLYPGNTRELELPFDRPFDYQTTVLERSQKRSFE